MSKYLITLTPTGKFFFGGDMTFKVGDDKTYNEEFSSYIIESNKMPQQTSLLGMLRFLILSNDDTAFNKAIQKIKDHDKAKSLIGESSFTVDDRHECKGFGKILSITPCFIRKGSVNLEPCRLDYGLDVRPGNGNCIVNGCAKSMYEIKYKDDFPYIGKDKVGSAYTPKIGIAHGYMECENYIKDVIFKEDKRIGIARNITSGKTDDEALFKQINYCFSENGLYCFAFTADIKDDLDLTKYSGQLVSLGGDNSSFVIGITKDDSAAEDGKIDGTKIVLLSPSYIEDINADYAITETIPFRFLKTTIHNKSYNITASRSRSEQYSLYKEGSVFYFKDKESCKAFAEKIEGYEDFYQIGYNHFKIEQ